MTSPYNSYYDNRAELIASQQDAVKKIAYFYAGRVRGAVDVEDLLQIAYLGLVDASHKFSPTENGSFQAYAGIKIKGAVIDYLRQSSNLSRSSMARRKIFEKATQDLTSKLGRLPSEAELAATLSITVDELHEWKASFNSNKYQSLDEIHEAHSEWLVAHDANVEDKLYVQELRDQLKDSLHKLKQNEALVLQLYYVEELNVYEISEILEISTGRVSQIKSSAIKFLRDDLKINHNT